MSFYSIDPEIRRAHTLPGSFYQDPAAYSQVAARGFGPSWQLIPEAEALKEHRLCPFVPLEGTLNDPLILQRDEDGRTHCYSNVCTHRGHVLLDRPGSPKRIRCRYHGRTFDCAGRFLEAPGFESAEGFPSETDHLPRLQVERFGPLTFVASNPEMAFDEWIAPVRERLGFLPFDEFDYSPAKRVDFPLDAHWALYCENYLEGFHIPFVHPGLTKVLDTSAYETIPFPSGVLQIGYSRKEDVAFELPSGHPDEGKRVAGYYFFLFPNLMLNFYPWGISVNRVRPIDLGRTEVQYAGYVWKPALAQSGAGGALDQVEAEDQQVVHSVQRGVRSSLYGRGRFSPDREQGVHHFHRWLSGRANPPNAQS